METLMIFNETNIYILSKLVAMVRRETGHRHRLNNQGAITELIREAARSKDERIQSYYQRFLENLNSDQIRTFVGHGIEIPAQYQAKAAQAPMANVRQHAYPVVKVG